MSMHIKPLTPIEEAGLRAHGLPVGTPSQLADAFRLGMAWADKARAESTLAEPNAGMARGALGAAGVAPGAAPGVDVAGAGLAGLVGGAVDG